MNKTTKCTKCGKEISIYSVFPHGYCVDCHAKATENEKPLTAREWAEQWKGVIQ